MKVVVGSKNKTKVGAVEKVWKDAEITSLSVPSGVAAQPFSDEETMQGAINRAKRALEGRRCSNWYWTRRRCNENGARFIYV